MSCIYAVFSDSCSEQERQLWPWPSTGETEQQMAAQYFPASQSSFSSEGLHGAPSTGSCLRLASCMALGSSALGAHHGSMEGTAKNKSQGQGVTLMYGSPKGNVSKHTVWICRWENFRLLLQMCCWHRTSVLSSMALGMHPLLSWIQEWAAQRCSWSTEIHNEFGTTLLPLSL